MNEPNGKKRFRGWIGKILAAAVIFIVVIAMVADGQSDNKPVGKKAEKKLPRLVDLGAKKCVPCKMMAPILEELRSEYAGVLTVEFIDVWENQDAGKQYKIRVIPTQIFFDPSGKELFRHVGFLSKEDILAKWKELGFTLKKK